MSLVGNRLIALHFVFISHRSLNVVVIVIDGSQNCIPTGWSIRKYRRGRQLKKLQLTRKIFRASTGQKIPADNFDWKKNSYTENL